MDGGTAVAVGVVRQHDSQDMVRTAAAVFAGITLMVVVAVRLGLAVKVATVWVKEVTVGPSFGRDSSDNACERNLMMVAAMRTWDSDGSVSRS